MPPNQTSDAVTIALLELGLNHLKERYSQDQIITSARLKTFKKSLDGMDAKLDEVLLFISAQDVKNQHAKEERDRIFKAGTMLPVAILTSVVSIGMNYVFSDTSGPKNPVTKIETSYIVPTRSEDLTKPLTSVLPSN
jgi:hypothetical protein